MSVVNTGPGGGLLFGMVYEPDAIGLLSRPARYQRCEVAYKDGITEAVVADVKEREDEGPGWMLLVSVGPEHAAEVAASINNGDGVALRVLG
jgi:hypothetical protein